ncbi:12392_t:CDS:2 [Racocetra persica]|uniref:12392_t:CDS:1 n=1 Tax=Racocetra persica TaxID=160502 RepID=A0ACA9NKY5_9GLOM|nr:12392_t:CDS:2 [Racocetra persica]
MANKNFKNRPSKINLLHIDGKILQDRFFEPLNLTVEKVAQDIKEKDRNDLDLACRLAYYFQIGSEVFLNIQQIYDLDAGKKTNMDNPETILTILIGLEVHITLAKLGYLGVLPIINPEVVLLGLKLAAALNMKISPFVLFDRKMYNYFDLPKGYQITQQEIPLATQGHLPIILQNRTVKIPIKVLQLEEDTAKSTYSSSGVKLDFNRSGNPLIELVTEPVFKQVETVLIFIKQLQNLLRYLEISEAKMEKGQLRVDLNFSLQLGGSYSTPRYEIKNLNSLANIEKALQQEVNKHQSLFSEGQKPPLSQTLGFDEAHQTTVTHREKTNYYYLPEVNIPPIKISSKEIKKIVQNLPPLP